MGKPQHQLKGKRFGKWLVLDYHDFKYTSRWKCRCDCGREYIVGACNLVNGSSVRCRECGYEASRLSNLTPGLPLTIWNTIVNGAKARGYELTISREEAYEIFNKQGGKCALTGIPLAFGRFGRRKLEERTASLDRIDNDKGYISGNVQWVHKHVNLMKQRFSQERFKELCAKVTDYDRAGNSDLQPAHHSTSAA